MNIFNQVRVSVIIPCYNIEKYLAECLDSVLSQSLEEIEVICINDGSTDSTPAILDSYKEKDARIAVIHQANGGVSVASNVGLSLARGEYVYLVDHDDIVKPNALKTCYSLAREYKTDAVHFNAESYFETAELEKQFPQLKTPKRIGYEQYNPTDGPTLFELLYSRAAYRVPLWHCFFSNAFLSEHQFRFVPGISSQDNVFSFQTILSSRSVVFCENSLYINRIRCGSVMTTPKKRKDAISRIIGLGHMKEFLEQIASNLPEDVYYAAKRYLNDQKNYINGKHLENLSITDVEYRNIFNSLSEYIEYINVDEKPPEKATLFSSNIRNKIANIL